MKIAGIWYLALLYWGFFASKAVRSPNRNVGSILFLINDSDSDSEKIKSPSKEDRVYASSNVAILPLFDTSPINILCKEYLLPNRFIHSVNISLLR